MTGQELPGDKAVPMFVLTPYAHILTFDLHNAEPLTAHECSFGIRRPGSNSPHATHQMWDYWQFIHTFDTCISSSVNEELQQHQFPWDFSGLLELF